MKPYVVIIKQMKDNKIILTEDELKSIVQRAYDDGHSDGYDKGYEAGRKNYWWNTPSITYNPNYPYGNTITTDHTNTPLYDGISITCKNDNKTGENVIL